MLQFIMLFLCLGHAACKGVCMVIPGLVLVQPRKTRSDITEKLLTGMLRIKLNQAASLKIDILHAEI